MAELFVGNNFVFVTQKLYARVDRAGAEGVSTLGRVGNSGKAKQTFIGI